jgi:hypothetical protein
MSNSLAAAVLTTPDLAEAIRAARTLLAIADADDGEVDFEAVIHSPNVLTRIRHVLPDLDWYARADADETSAKTGDDPAAHLPIRVFDWCRPLDRAEPFITALGPDPAAIRWDLNGWPEVPEAGLAAISQKYAYLTLSVNSRDLYQEEPSEDHTLHVHVADEAHDTPRIEWLAARIGGHYDGRSQGAPL